MRVITYLLAALSIVVSYNACAPFGALNEGSGSFSSNAEERQEASLLAFEKNLYPTLRNNCGQCHGVSQRPLFAVDELRSAHDTLIENDLVSLNFPSSSYLLQKLNTGHNGFAKTLIDQIEVGITQWANDLAEFDLENSTTDNSPKPYEP